MEIRFDYSRSFVRLLFSSRAYLNKNSCVRGTTREFLSAIAGLLTARNNKRWPCRQNHLEGANLIRSFWLSKGAFRKFFMSLRRGRDSRQRVMIKSQNSARFRAPYCGASRASSISTSNGIRREENFRYERRRSTIIKDDSTTLTPRGEEEISSFSSPHLPSSSDTTRISDKNFSPKNVNVGDWKRQHI